MPSRAFTLRIILASLIALPLLLNPRSASSQRTVSQETSSKVTAQERYQRQKQTAADLRKQAIELRHKSRATSELERATKKLEAANARLLKLQAKPVKEMRDSTALAEAEADVADAQLKVDRLAAAASLEMPLSVCPDEPIYPTDPGGTVVGRSSFSEPWMRDYPIFTFNAKTGKRFWQEGGSRIQEPVTSLFAPSTFTTEKILIRVCGLHFYSKPVLTPVTQTVPAGGPQYDDSVQQAPAVAPPNVQKTLDDIARSGYALLMDRSSASEAGSSCNDLSEKIKAARAALTDEELAEKRITFTLQSLDPSADTKPLFEALRSDIANEVAAEERVLSKAGPYSDVLAFRTSRDNSGRQSAQLALFVTRLNTLLSSKDFRADWITLSNIQRTLDDLLIAARNARMSDVHCEELDDVESLKAELSKAVGDAQTYISKSTKQLEEGRKLLAQDQLSINHEDSNLNDWYSKSSVSTYFYLDPVAVNSLTEIQFNVTDPWKPITPPELVAMKEIPTTKAGPPTPTTITVTQTKDPPATQVLIGPGSGTSPDSVAVDIAPQPKAADAPKAATVSNVQIVKALGAATPKASTSNSSASTVTPADTASADGNIPVATHFFERHRFINFTASSGLLVTRFTQQTYAAQVFPLTITTTTSISSSLATTAPTYTVVQTSATPTFAAASQNGPFQQSAVLGFTWYPFGRDTYPIALLRKGKPHTYTYAQQSLRSHLGIFVGTSVSSIGPFIVGPTFEVTPGIQLLAGLTLQQRNSLAQGIVPCRGQSTATKLGQPATTTVTSAGGVSTTTTIEVDTTGGCSDPSATLLSGSSVPTNQSLKPAFGFGVLFNSALFKTLGFIK